MIRQHLRLELPPPAVGALSLSEALEGGYLLAAEETAKRKTKRKRGEEDDGGPSSSIPSTPTSSLPRSAVLALGRAGVTRQALARAQAALAAAAAASAMGILGKKNGKRGGREERLPVLLLPRPSLSLQLLQQPRPGSEASRVFTAAAAAAAPGGAPLPGRLARAVSSVAAVEAEETVLPARARADAWLCDAPSFDRALSAAALAAVSAPDPSSSSSSSSSSSPLPKEITLLLPALALEPDLLAPKALWKICEWLRDSAGHPRLWRLAESVWRCRSLPSSSAGKQWRLRRRGRRGGTRTSSSSESQEEEEQHLERLRECLAEIGEIEGNGDVGALVAAAAAAADAAEEEDEAASSDSSSSSLLWMSLAPAKSACERCLELLFSGSDGDGGAGKTKEAAASLAARFFCPRGVSSSGRGGRGRGREAERRKRERVSETLLLAASRAPSSRNKGAAALLSWARWLSGDAAAADDDKNDDGRKSADGGGDGEEGAGAKDKNQEESRQIPSPCAVLGPWVSRVMLPLAWLSCSSSFALSLDEENEREGEEDESLLLLLLRRVGGAASPSPSPPSLGPTFALNAAREALEWARGRRREVGKEVERELEEAVAARAAAAVLV